MKRILVLLTFLSGYGAGLAQDTCSKYYPMQEGTTIQMSMYNDTDKLQGVIDYVVKEASGDTATMTYEMQDEKGKMISASEYDITCKDDGVSIDMRSLMTPGVMEQYKDMEVDMTGTELVLPNNLSEGQSLPDAEVLMNIKMAPLNLKMSSKMFNRKVQSRESVTTPAGTFDCFLITSDNESKMGIKISGSSKLWLSEGVGMVKQETYNKKGKLTGVMLLTEYSK